MEVVIPKWKLQKNELNIFEASGTLMSKKSYNDRVLSDNPNPDSFIPYLTKLIRFNLQVNIGTDPDQSQHFLTDMT